MPSVTLSSLVGGGSFKMAPDLTYPASLNSAASYKTINLNPAGGLTTALSLSGKWQVFLMQFENLTAENITVKLTVDSEVIWNSSFTSSTILRLIGSVTNTIPNPSEPIFCDNSMLLEIQTATDTSVDLRWNGRPLQ